MGKRHHISLGKQKQLTCGRKGWDSFWPGRWDRYPVLSSMPVWFFSFLDPIHCHLPLWPGKGGEGKITCFFSNTSSWVWCLRRWGEIPFGLFKSSNLKVCSFFHYYCDEASEDDLLEWNCWCNFSYTYKYSHMCIFWEYAPLSVCPQ